jgi:Cation/multidrug efflux pump
VPAEDQGYVFLVTILPPAASISRTREVTKEATAALMKNPAVANVVTFSGFDLLSRALKTNSGISFVTLKDWSVRQIRRRTRATWRRRSSGSTPTSRTASSSASTRRRSRASASPAASSSICRIARAARSTACRRRQQGGGRRQQAARAARRFHHLHHAVPQYRTDVDREKARALGIPINTIFDTMQSSFGSLYVNDFSLYGRTYRVSLSSEPTSARSRTTCGMSSCAPTPAPWCR